MSLSLKDTDDAMPIAKIHGTNKLIYLLPRSSFKKSNRLNQASDTFECPYCKKKLATLQGLQYHTSKSCKKIEEYKQSDTPKHAIEFTDRDVFPLPRFTTEETREEKGRDLIYITGAQESGKSHWVAQYIKSYKVMHPEDEIILFTRLKCDNTFIKMDVEKHITRCVLNDSMLEDKYTLEELENSLVIVDDIEDSKLKEVTEYIYDLADDIAKNGRHLNINMLYVTHQATDFKRTRDMLNEVRCVVVFPNKNMPYQIIRLLKTYMGMQKKEINKIFRLDTRPVYINCVDMYVVYDHGCYLLNTEIYD